jgi:hypothetical protein
VPPLPTKPTQYPTTHIRYSTTPKRPRLQTIKFQLSYQNLQKFEISERKKKKKKKKKILKKTRGFFIYNISFFVVFFFFFLFFSVCMLPRPPQKGSGNPAPRSRDLKARLYATARLEPIQGCVSGVSRQWPVAVVA